MQNDTKAELYACFKKSYDEVLRHHHSFIIRSVVSVSFLISMARSSVLLIGLSSLNCVCVCNCE